LLSNIYVVNRETFFHLQNGADKESTNSCQSCLIHQWERFSHYCNQRLADALVWRQSHLEIQIREWECCI